LRDDLAATHLENEHRPRRSPPPLGRAARVEDPDAVQTLDLRQMRVPVDNRPAPEKPRAEPLPPPGRRPRIVHHPDPSAARFDNPFRPQDTAQRRLVDVPVDTLDPAERPQLPERRQRDEVARVQDQTGLPEEPDALLGKAPRTAWKMGVGDDG
jgi:hypothetical protein